MWPLTPVTQGVGRGATSCQAWVRREGLLTGPADGTGLSPGLPAASVPAQWPGSCHGARELPEEQRTQKFPNLPAPAPRRHPDTASPPQAQGAPAQAARIRVGLLPSPTRGNAECDRSVMGMRMEGKDPSPSGALEAAGVREAAGNSRNQQAGSILQATPKSLSLPSKTVLQLAEAGKGEGVASPRYRKERLQHISTMLSGRLVRVGNPGCGSAQKAKVGVSRYLCRQPEAWRGYPGKATYPGELLMSYEAINQWVSRGSPAVWAEQGSALARC